MTFTREVAGVEITDMELYKVGDTHVIIRETPMDEEADPMYRLSRAIIHIDQPGTLVLTVLGDHETLTDAVEAAVEDRKARRSPV